MCLRTIRPMILRHQSTAGRRGFDRADMEFCWPTREGVQNDLQKCLDECIGDLA
jgi:hypothetical protein